MYLGMEMPISFSPLAMGAGWAEGSHKHGIVGSQTFEEVAPFGIVVVEDMLLEAKEPADGGRM
jgi:hypothetical protein